MSALKTNASEHCKRYALYTFDKHDMSRSARLAGDAACYTTSANRYEDIEQACKREIVNRQ